jgi:protein CpxP
MTRFRALTITAALTALLAGGAAFAQGPGFSGRRGGGPGLQGGFGVPGGRGGGGLPIRELNLSETQQQQIRDLTQQYREQSRAAAEQLRTAMEAQRKAVETLPVNEGLIRSTTQALVEAQTELAIQQARMQGEIFALLTPAQQDQAKKLQDAREARFQQQRQRK